MWSCRIIKSEQAFQQLSANWDAMLSDCKTSGFFMSHTYLSTWWTHYGTDLKLFVIIVEENDKLIAAAPLCIRSVAKKSLNIRMLEIIGTGPVPTRPMGLSDRVDMVVRKDREEALIEIAETLNVHGDSWDILHLKGICLKESSIEILLNHLKKISQVTKHISLRYRSPYLPIKGTFEDYKKTRSKDFRKKLNRCAKRSQKTPSMKIEKTGQQVDETLMDDIRRICMNSWKGSRGSGLFLHPFLHVFFKDLFFDCQQKGLIWVYFLSVNNCRIAHEICFRDTDKLYSYDSCYDSRYGDISPGTQLTKALVEDAHAAGFKEYDMLRGDEPYKIRWSSLARDDYEIVLTSGKIRARIYAFCCIRLKWALKRSRFLSMLHHKLHSYFHKKSLSKDAL